MDAFLSYAHEDGWAKDALQKHAAVLMRSGLITIWQDREILPGASIDQSIDGALEKSSLILFLISPDFIVSDYCMGREMKRALELHKEGTAKLVPIICRPCDWAGIEDLSGLMALPTDAKPISKWEDQDEAWAVVVGELRRLLQADSSAASNSTQTTSEPSVAPINHQKARQEQGLREFTDIDRNNFKERAFEVIKEYFQQQVKALDQQRGIMGKIEFDNGQSFCCTIVSKRYLSSTTHITVRMGTGHMKNRAIYWLFEQYASEGLMNDSYAIESNGSNLYLRLSSSANSRDSNQLTPEQAAKILWQRLTERARINIY